MNNKIKSHATRISRDELLHGIADYCIKHNCSIDRAISDFIKLAIKQPGFRIWLSGSIYTSYYGNSQDYAMNKIIKVDYGKNAVMIIGNIIHRAREYAINEKIAFGKIPKLTSCIRTMKIELHKEYKGIRPDDRENISKVEIFKKSVKYFKAYYEKVLPFNKSICSEVKMEASLPLSMFNNPNNAKYFSMNGIADSIEVTKEGNLTITDLKTSKLRISGKVEIDPMLQKYFDAEEIIQKKLISFEKQIKKFVNAQEKLDESQTTLEDVTNKLTVVNNENNVIIKENEANDKKKKLKATASLEKRVKKWKDEFLKWEENLNIFNNAEKEKELLLLELKELHEVMQPLKELYDNDKKIADLEACKKAHQSQLLHYAICYMFTYKKKPTHLRVENIVKNQTEVEIQIFEWKITHEDLLEIQEKITTVINTNELIIDGIDPLLIFRANPTSYIGSETEKLKDEVKMIIDLHKELK